MVLAIILIAMLLLYWLIGKRILYNIWMAWNFNRILMIIITSHIVLGQFANIISCPPSRTDGFTSVLLK